MAKNIFNSLKDTNKKFFTNVKKRTRTKLSRLEHGLGVSCSLVHCNKIYCIVEIDIYFGAPTIFHDQCIVKNIIDVDNMCERAIEISRTFSKITRDFKPNKQKRL